MDLQPGEVLLSVEIPLGTPRTVCASFKQSHRRDDDIAICTAGMRIVFADPADSADPADPEAAAVVKEAAKGKKWEDQIAAAVQPPSPPPPA